MKIRIYRKSPDIPLPVRQTPGSAGLDIYAAERTELMPGEVAIIPTGLLFYRAHPQRLFGEKRHFIGE